MSIGLMDICQCGCCTSSRNTSRWYQVRLACSPSAHLLASYPLPHAQHSTPPRISHHIHDILHTVPSRTHPAGRSCVRVQHHHPIEHDPTRIHLGVLPGRPFSQPMLDVCHSSLSVPCLTSSACHLDNGATLAIEIIDTGCISLFVNCPSLSTLNILVSRLYISGVDV
jgi:hypothetical protein